MHSSRMLGEGARTEIVRDNLGHVECRRDPECLQQELVGRARDEVTQAVEAVTYAAQNAEKEENGDQPESAPAGGQNYQPPALPHVQNSASCFPRPQGVASA